MTRIELRRPRRWPSGGRRSDEREGTGGPRGRRFQPGQPLEPTVLWVGVGMGPVVGVGAASLGARLEEGFGPMAFGVGVGVGFDVVGV